MSILLLPYPAVGTERSNEDKRRLGKEAIGRSGAKKMRTKSALAVNLVGFQNDFIFRKVNSKAIMTS